MSAIGFLELGLFGALVGFLVGCVGIGGVLLVPALTYAGGIDVHVAVAAAMFSYLASGVIGTTIYARQGSIAWSMAPWLFLGAIPAAFFGAWASSKASGTVLEIAIAALILFAGANALRPRPPGRQRRTELGNGCLATLGAVCGFGSALTGTGGPLILVPLLVWLDLPVLTAIGLSQAIQLPIAALATAGNLLYGRLDAALGIVIAAAIAAGTVLGAWLAHVVPHSLLHRSVAWLLVLVGVGMIAKNAALVL